MTRTQKMLAAAVIGAAAGLAANALVKDAGWLQAVITYGTLPVGQIFLRLLFMLVVPLVFAALVVGVADLDLRHLGRIGGRMLAYTIGISAVAVVIGLVLVNVIQPGRGGSEELRELARHSYASAPAAVAKPPAAVDLIVGMVPQNPIQAAASGDMIAVIVFALVFGIGLALTPTPGSARLREAITGIYDVMMRLLEGIMRLAPLGIGCLLFTAMARLGLDLLVKLGAYVFVVLLGLGLHMTVVYSLSVWLLGGMSPLRFFRDAREAIVTAFTTASSAATLPTALRVAEQNLGLPSHVSRFVLTAGSTMNQNGTALFEGVTVLFLAQLFGTPLTMSQQVIVMVICIFGGIGTAGVPAGSIPVVAMILAMFGVPPEGLGLILGVDRLLDMCRTTLNVTGDLAAAVYVSRGEPAASAAAPPSGEPVAEAPDA